MTSRTLSLIFLLAASPLCAAGEVVIVAADKPLPDIVLSEEAEDQERAAARDLQDYLGRMTGRTAEIVSTARTDRPAIQIGKVPGNSDLLAEAEKQALARDGFILEVTASGIRIVGGSKFGTSYGVYELLERFGVRWFFPGAWGEVVPQTQEIRLAAGRTVDQPAFSIRQMHSAWVDEETGDWFRRNRHNRSGFYGHSHLISTDKYAAAHPDWYAEINGLRVVDDPNYKLCHSNDAMVTRATEEVLEAIRQRKSASRPEVHNGMELMPADYTLISISPRDGGGFCRCAECSKIPSVSDRLRNFANKIAAKVREEFPEYSVGYYGAYSEHQAPPTLKAEPGVVVIPTTWTRNFFKPLSDKSNRAFREKFAAFSRNAPAMALRDYDGLPVWWGYGPLSLADVHAEDYQWYHQQGVQGIITEAASGWGPLGYSYYLTSKLWWNPSADLEALKADFVTKAYGEAAEPMKTYFKLLDEAVIHPSPRSLHTMRQKLEEAAALAVDPGVRKRINYLRAHFLLTDIYEKHQAGEASPDDVAQFHRVLQSIDPSASLFSRSRRYLKTFPKEPENTAPYTETELEQILASVALPLPGREYAAWLDQDDLRLEPADRNPRPDVSPSIGMTLRYGPATLLIRASAGERIVVRQTAKRWTAFDTAFQLLDPELTTLAEGLAEGETILDLPAPSDGIYTLTLSPGGRYPEIHVSNQWVVTKAGSKSQNIQPMGRVKEAYFYVPKGTKEFSIVAKAYEPLRIQIDGPIVRPSPLPAINQQAQVFQEHAIPVQPGQDGTIWRMALEGGKKDLYLQGIPPFLAGRPERLLIPPGSDP
ncbi:MAG TPA: DUF4838 domain-containing protein [Terrimicrobiaceae bacterium]|nr:DUF4838 domain-containing protein [Terrimicrobiaceae bacterium]